MQFCRLLPLLSVCLAMLLNACSSLPSSRTATVDYNRSYDFSHVHDIAIQPIARDTIETMMMSDVQIISIKEALTEELQQRGFKVVTGDSDADLFLAWRFVPDEGATLSTFDPATQNITEATLYVDMVDPVILQTVWRANVRLDLRDQSDTNTVAEYSRRAAEAILMQFPTDKIER